MVLTPAGSPGEGTTGEIYRTDLTGDGTVGDIFPANTNHAAGTPGQFMRSITASNLTNAISNWNTTQAGTLTPASQALVTGGYFTTAQLQTLGAVKPFVQTPPAGEVGNGIFREVSSVLSWPIKIRERFSIEPSIAAYNVFGLANFGRLTGNLNVQTTPFTPGTPFLAGNVGGTTSANRDSVRIGTGSGVFSLGAPRQVEFGLKFNF
jgi:hypothetical protein